MSFDFRPEPQRDPFDIADEYRSKIEGTPYKAPSLERYYSSLGSASAYAEGRGTAPKPTFSQPGPPIRFQFNALDEFTSDAVQSPVGVAAGLGQPDRLGGSIDLMGARLKTMPINASNFASYAREANLAAITSVLGHQYQRPDAMYEQPAGPENTADIFENLASGNLPGVLDNVVDGLVRVGDTIQAPFTWFSDQVRQSAARDRAVGVAQLIASGDTVPQAIQFITHIFDLDGIADYQTIMARAQEKGVPANKLIADLWNLPELVVDQIAKSPMSYLQDPGKLWDMVEGVPFSNSAFENLIGELGITLAPLLIGAGEIRGVGLALRGLRAGTVVSGLRGTGLTGSLLANAVGPVRALAVAERLGAWSLPKAWRYIQVPLRVGGAVTGATPTGLKIGTALRFGEWAVGQIGVAKGDQAMVDMADRWLQETPLSQSPGLNMIDAFMVHPMAAAKRVGRAAIRVVGYGDVMSEKLARVSDSFKAMSRDELQSRMLDDLGWDPAQVRGFVENPASGIGLDDLKNGLIHTALQVVRARHPESAAISPGDGMAARQAEFVTRYGDEAATLLRDELAGRGTAIRDAIREEFWTRERQIAGSELGQEGNLGPYHPPTALVQFVSWVRMSKAIQKAYGRAAEVVPALRPDVNLEFLADLRAHVAATYPKPGSFISQADLLRLTTFVPAAKTVAGGVLGRRKTTPRVTRRTLEALLDDLTKQQTEQNLATATLRRSRGTIMPGEEADVARIAGALDIRADTVVRLQSGVADGPVPTDLVAVLERELGMRRPAILAAPEQSWERAIAWFETAYADAASRGASLDALDRFERSLHALTSEEGTLVRTAIERISTRLRNPPGRPREGQAPLSPLEAEAYAALDDRLAVLVDRISAYLEDPRRSMSVDVIEGVAEPVLQTEGYTALMARQINDIAARVLRDDAAKPIEGLTAERRAMLEQPDVHPLDKAAIIREVVDPMDYGAPYIRGLSDLEGTYGELLDAVRPPDAPPEPVTPAAVAGLTREVAALGAEKAAILAETKALGTVVTHDPRAVVAPDVRAVVDEVGALGAIPIRHGGRKAGRAVPWQEFPVTAEAARTVANEAAVRAGRAELERTLASRERLAAHFVERAALASERAGDVLTEADFVWEAEALSAHPTMKAAADAAKELTEAGIPVLIRDVPAPRGGKKLWKGLFRGELRERPETVPVTSVEGAPPEGTTLAPAEPGAAPPAAPVEPTRPAPLIVERLAEPDRVAAAKAAAYEAEQAARQEAFRAHAEAYPERRRVPVVTEQPDARLLEAERQRVKKPLSATEAAKALGDDGIIAKAIASTEATIERFADAPETARFTDPWNAAEKQAPRLEALRGIRYGIETGRWDPQLIASVIRRGDKELMVLADRAAADLGPERLGPADVSRWFSDHIDELTGRAPETTVTRPAPVEVTFLDPQDNATPIRSRVVLVDAADVLTSDQPGFPANLQPRSRDIRASSQEQILEYARKLQADKLLGTAEGGTGMPVVTPEGAVLAGNGRIGALRLTSRKMFDGYRARIAEEAPKYGFDPAVIEAMDRPVLVRELVDVDPVTQNRLAWQLNEMPTGDLAPSVASALTRADIARLAIGDEQALLDALHSPANEAAVAQMIGRLPRDWHARYFDPKTGINAQGARLLEGALLSKLLRADDRTLPGFEDARRVVFQVVEQEAEEIRRIAGGLAEGAGQLLKAQDKAEAGTIGGEILAITDDLTPALARLIELKGQGLNTQGILNSLDNLGAFDEISLTAQQTHLARLLASSGSQREIRAFLRRVAEAAEANAPEGGSLFADQRLDATGILNAGVDRWNALRREAGKPELDHFPSAEAPYDIPLSGARELPDGATAPPVLESQPMSPAEVSESIELRAPGPKIVHAETLRDARRATETPAGLEVRDPAERAFVEAYRADPEGVRGDVIDAFDTARRFTQPDARADYLKALIGLANDGTISPDNWAVLESLIFPIRRNTKGRINSIRHTGAVAEAWTDLLKTGLEERLAQLDWLDRLVEDPAASRVVMDRPQAPISEAELHDATGPGVPHSPDVPLSTELAQTADHVVMHAANPTTEAAVRRAIGAPAVRPAGERLFEFNQRSAQAQAERLSSLAQQARAAQEAAERAIADYDANPTIPAAIEQTSVFASADDAALWTKLMGAADPIRGGEPRTLGALIDAINSIDRGMPGALTPDEAVRLRSTLLRLAAGTANAARSRLGIAEARRRTRRFRPPDDWDPEEVAAAADALNEEVAKIVVTDPALSPLDGYVGTQYIVSPPTGAAAGVITPRLAFGDYLDVIPGLADEIRSGRMMEFAERIHRTRFARWMDNVIGPRSTRAMHDTAVANFTRAIEGFVPENAAAEAEFIEKAVRDVVDAWRTAAEGTQLADMPFALFRRVDLMGAKRLEALAEPILRERIPATYAALKAAMGEAPLDRIWRRADNRLRQTLLRSNLPLTDKLERLHGAVANSKLGKTGRWLTVLYQLDRFVGEPRFLAMEHLEPHMLAFFHGGLDATKAARSAETAAAARQPRMFGQMAQRARINEYAHWTRISDFEQVTPLRWRVLINELGRRQERPFVEAVLEMFERDPQARRMLVDLGDPGKPLSATELLDRLDRDWTTLEQGTREFANEGEARAFFKPWLDADTITAAEFDEFVRANKFTGHPAIMDELAKSAGNPLAQSLYTRLAQINHGLYHDLTATMFGQENRSNLQRVLNNPFLFWPISYQIKATKWLLRFMGEEMFGYDTGALGAVALEQIYQEHKRRMAEDERYRENLQANATLYFVAQMFLPISPWDIGVTLSPWTRLALSATGLGPHYERPFGALGYGIMTTYGFASRILREKINQGLPFGEELEPFLPTSITTRQRPNEGATSQMGAELERVGAGRVVPPELVPPVPKLP